MSFVVINTYLNLWIFHDLSLLQECGHSVMDTVRLRDTTLLSRL